MALDNRFSLGFLHCSKRMNVAISRAQSLLVVFAKESILSLDENWRNLIEYTKQKGTHVTISRSKQSSSNLS
jgi:RNA helicase armi